MCVYSNKYVLWEKFFIKYLDTSPIDSRTTLMIITMIAQQNLA